MASGDQLVLQVKTAQSRHLHIGDEARCVAELLGIEKFDGGAKRGNAVAERSQETFHPLAQGIIVIDNRNYTTAHLNLLQIAVEAQRLRMM